MSFNGHVIQNKATNLYVDLYGSNFAPRTPVILFPLNQTNITRNQTSGTRNQNVRFRFTCVTPKNLSLFFFLQWRLIPVDVGQNLWSIQNVLTSLYASPDGSEAVRALPL